MSKNDLFSKRFSELLHQADVIYATKTKGKGDYSDWEYIDQELYIGWKAKVENLIIRACGENSTHLRAYLESQKVYMGTSNIDTFRKSRAVLAAAQDDYDGGYIVSVRNIIRAEVFDSELEQARELLSNGYISAAAVVAGVVLETTLRQLCTDASPSIPHGKLDKMNADLTKAGIYSLLVQKRITALADIRNNAAHGHPEKFKQSDVEDMIAYIESFVSQHL